MSTYNQFQSFETNPPAAVVDRALIDATLGIMPQFTSEQLNAATGLDAPEADGLSLTARCLGADRSFTNRRHIPNVMMQVPELIAVTNEYRANPAQERLAKILGETVMRQMDREGDICPIAEQYVLLSSRDDIVPRQYRDRAKQNMASEVEHLFEAFSAAQSGEESDQDPAAGLERLRDLGGLAALMSRMMTKGGERGDDEGSFGLLVIRHQMIIVDESSGDPASPYDFLNSLRSMDIERIPRPQRSAIKRLLKRCCDIDL